MLDALVISNTNSLDFQEIRQNVIRIPEVVHRIRQAQEIWDSELEKAFDLANFIGSEDCVFLGNIRLKTLAAAVVQVGLVDRYLKTHRRPDFLLGVSNGDSALKVIVGELSFAEMVLQSPALAGKKGPAMLTAVGTPVLAGISLGEFSLYQQKNGDYVLERGQEMDLRRLVREMIHDYSVREVITVGPGDSLVKSALGVQMAEVGLKDSIQTDPMLDWFWSQVSQERPAAVQ